MDDDHIVNGWIRDHWARRRSSSGCRSMNSSTAARNGYEGDDPFRFRNSTNCLTDSCSSGVSELMTSARFSVAIVAFQSQYTPAKRGVRRKWVSLSRNGRLRISPLGNGSPSCKQDSNPVGMQGVYSTTLSEMAHPCRSAPIADPT